MTAGPDQAPRRALARTFASLSGHNYRLWVGGQSISLVGTWMQSIAQSWLVYELTGSAAVLGTVVAVQTVPTLLLGPYAGVWVDRLDRRRLMIGLQTMMGLQAAALAVLTLTGTVALWHVYVLAAVLGLNKAVENPARQTFVHELVGPDDLRNAVTLNSVLVNAARAVGPAVAGLVIVAGGTGICFAVNAVSFVAVVTSLLRLDTSALVPTAPAPRAPGQLREGLAHVRANPELRVPLVMMALIGCLAYEFPVVLPVVASQTFGGDVSTYGWLTGAMGVGAVVGGSSSPGTGAPGCRCWCAPRCCSAWSWGSPRSRRRCGSRWSRWGWSGWPASRSWRAATRRCSWPRPRTCGDG